MKRVKQTKNEISPITFAMDHSYSIYNIYGLKGGLTAFFSLHDCVYGVQYNMYSCFFFFLNSYFS